MCTVDNSIKFSNRGIHKLSRHDFGPFDPKSPMYFVDKCRHLATPCICVILGLYWQGSLDPLQYRGLVNFFVKFTVFFSKNSWVQKVSTGPAVNAFGFRTLNGMEGFWNCPPSIHPRISSAIQRLFQKTCPPDVASIKYIALLPIKVLERRLELVRLELPDPFVLLLLRYWKLDAPPPRWIPNPPSSSPDTPLTLVQPWRIAFVVFVAVR